MNGWHGRISISEYGYGWVSRCCGTIDYTISGLNVSRHSYTVLPFTLYQSWLVIALPPVHPPPPLLPRLLLRLPVLLVSFIHFHN